MLHEVEHLYIYYMSIIYIKLPAAQQPAASNIKFYADDDVFSRRLKQALLALGGKGWYSNFFYEQSVVAEQPTT
jgi:hypothetical protein